MDSQLVVENEDIYGTLEEDRNKKCSSEDNPCNGDDVSSTNTETPSEPWYDEQDLLHSDAIEEKQEGLDDLDILYDFVSSCALDESNLKEKEVDLYNDLIILENEEKKTKINEDADYDNLKKELVKLQESDTLKNNKISELSAEVINLKKNICSLYKTAKSEIEHKNALLAEANRKLDNVLFRKNLQSCRNCRNERRGNSDAERKKSDIQSLDDRHGNGISIKRKRLNDSPSSSYPGKESESVRSSSKRLKNLDSGTVTSDQFTSQSHSSVSKNSKMLQKVASERDLETPETIKHSSNSRDSTETNNLFFNLLPPPLKQSFYEYEQSQIISLNKLKQTFVNQYFNDDLNVQPPSLEMTPKRPRTSRLPSRFDQNFSGAFSVNTESLLTPSTTHQDRKFVSTDGKSVSDIVTEKKIRLGNYDCQITKLNQKDIATLYSYRKQKIPFLTKRKFGLLKNSKASVS